MSPASSVGRPISNAYFPCLPHKAKIRWEPFRLLLGAPHRVAAQRAALGAAGRADVDNINL